MAQEILVSIQVNSSKANEALAKNSKAFRDNKKSIDSVAVAKAKLAKLRKPEATELAVVNEQIKIQNKLNTAAAQARLKLTQVKEKETAVDRRLRTAEEKLAFLRSDEALKLQRVNQQIKIQNDLNTALIRSEMGLATSKAAVNSQQKQFRTQSGLSNAIILESGRLATDASYGFTAIANNLSQIVSLSSSFIDTTGSIRDSFKKLGRDLMGTGGVLLALQVFIGILQTKAAQNFIKRMTGISNTMRLMTETFKSASEGVSDLNGGFELYIRTIQDSTVSQEQYNSAVNSLVEKYPDFIQNLQDAGVALNDLTEKTANAEIQTKAYRDSLVELALSRAAMTKIEELAGDKLDIRIQKEREAREAGFKSLDEAEKYYEEERQRRLEAGIDTTQRVQDGTNTLIQTYKNEEGERFASAERLVGLRKADSEELDGQIEILREYVDLGLKIGEKPIKAKAEFDFSEIDVDLDIDEDDRDFSIANLFKRSYYTEDFEEQLDQIPEFIEDAEEVAENYARGKAKESLLSKILKISPASRENDLKKLKDGLAKFGSTTIEATQEYKDAIQAVNDKWDAIELKSKLDHYKNIASATAGFFSEMSRLNDQNKDLARASIIANSAAASIGIWQSYFDPKTPEKGTLALIASGIAQVGLIASTANALNSLNSDSALSSSSVNATQVQAPAFNVVGASPLDLLMVDISNKLEKPIPAYITAKGAIGTLDEYYRNVRTGSNS